MSHNASPTVDTATDPIRSSADLQQRWCALLSPLGFGEPLLRFVPVGPDRCFVKILSDVEIPAVADPAPVRKVMAALAVVLDDLEPGTTVAFLLSRPGRGGITPNDRYWAQLVSEYADRYEVPIEPFFLANDEDVAEVPCAA